MCINSEEDDMPYICVLAILEIGICYLWFGNNIEKLRNENVTKISLSLEGTPSENYRGALSTKHLIQQLSYL